MGGVGDTSLLRKCIDDSRAISTLIRQSLCWDSVAESQKLRFPSLLRLACEVQGRIVEEHAVET